MTATVKEIMNAEVFSLRATNTVEEALNGIIGLGITGAPVVDEEGRPIGVVSLRDLVGERSGSTVADRMTSPPAVTHADERIAQAAKLMGEAGFHRLIVVDEKGVAVGVVSALDVVRALAGVPARHPAAFPHLDLKTHVAWTDDAVLDLDHADIAPDGPGLLTLSYDVPGRPETVVWAEASNNLRTRLLDLITLPQDSAHLRAWLVHRKHLRFRAAAVSDDDQRRRLCEALRAGLRRHLPAPVAH